LNFIWFGVGGFIWGRNRLEVMGFFRRLQNLQEVNYRWRSKAESTRRERVLVMKSVTRRRSYGRGDLFAWAEGGEIGELYQPFAFQIVRRSNLGVAMRWGRRKEGICWTRWWWWCWCWCWCWFWHVGKATRYAGRQLMLDGGRKVQVHG
jgi:hypothetical protein